MTKELYSHNAFIFSGLFFVHLLLLSNIINAQNDSVPLHGLKISGHVELEKNDRVKPGSFVLLTKIYPKDSSLTKTIPVGADGHFKTDSIKAGKYRISFWVEDYYFMDSVITLTKTDFNNLHLRLTKRQCSYNSDFDIRNNGIKILIATQGGLRSNSKADNSFQKKFKINYLILSPPHNNWSCLKNYNKDIFNHLDKKYGTKWRKDARRDAIGFSEGTEKK